MYLEHFGVREYPFSITPDTSFFFSSESSRDALSTLLVAVRTGEGFIKITGEVGTGKTLLCRKLIASLDSEFKIGYVPNPYLEPRTLFLELASELGVPLEPASKPDQHEILKALTQRLLELISEGKRIVIILDEVQAMPIETLEALRLLSNLETEKRKLLQVVIFGQPELEEKLDHPSVRQLKQRITFDFNLSPLSRSELDYYIHHRLMVAGYEGGRLFTPSAMWLLQRRTRRVPRLVNVIAHKAMLSAYGKGRKSVTILDVLAAARDTASTRGVSWKKRIKLASIALIGSSIAGMGWVFLK